MNDYVLWKKLNEQLDAEYIDQLDKNFIMQHQAYFETNFAVIRALDSGYAFPPLEHRKIPDPLDGLTSYGKRRFRELEDQFNN